MDTQNILNCIAIALIEYRDYTAQDVDELFNLSRWIYEENQHGGHKDAVQLAEIHSYAMTNAKVGD